MFFKILSVLSLALKLFNKFYDEYIRRKYKQEGKNELNASNKKIIDAEIADAKVVSDIVDKESEDEVNKGLIDPRA